MSARLNRRSFLKKSAALAVTAPLVTSVEEYRLLAGQPDAAAPGVDGGPQSTLPLGTIGQLKISRLICGGNLISGYAHSRDLIYTSKLIKAYHTDAKIMETWALCEQNGINTMIFTTTDEHALRVYQDYLKKGGKLQCIAQLTPPQNGNLEPCIRKAVDAGVEAVVLVGNLGDQWSRKGAVDRIGEFVELAQMSGVVAGVAGHELRTPKAVEQAGIKADFYMKTLHTNNYWSRRRPDQLEEVVDNTIDNYWCRDPEGTIEFMKTTRRPWLAYKVLAAGAIHPREGFKHAFQNGADFCVVGMFDFQVAENVAIANEVLKLLPKRERPWMA